MLSNLARSDTFCPLYSLHNSHYAPNAVTIINVSKFLTGTWVGAQISAPYNKTPGTTEQYTSQLVSRLRSRATNTALQSAPNVLEAFAIQLDPVILPCASTRDP